MKRLVSFLLLASAVAAQENNPDFAKNHTSTGVASLQDTLLSGFRGGLFLQANSGTQSASKPEPNPPAQQKGTTPQPPPPPEQSRPSIPGSMVGYIDNAVVESQIRIRFDAGFDTNAPDRAEFFYAQCSCISGSAPGPNAVIANLNFQEVYLRAEYAPRKRFSLLAEVPTRWIQPLSTKVVGSPPLTKESGLSDLLAGFKLAAIASASRYLTFQFQAAFPTGDAWKGLGTNHYSVEPALLYYQRLADRVALEAQIGDLHPIGGSSCVQNLQHMNLPYICSNIATSAPTHSFAGDVFSYGVGPSYVIYGGENFRVAPVIEVVGWRVLGGLVTDVATATSTPINSGGFQQAVSADGTNVVNLKVGARTMVGAHGSFYIGYGHQLTHAVWYKEIVRAEYRYSF
jgi:Putative MetA-pathway of phenol degradation